MQDWRDYFLATPNVHNGLLALLEGSKAAREDWSVYRSQELDPPSVEPVTSLPETWIIAFWDAVPDKNSRWADFSERSLVEGTLTGGTRHDSGGRDTPVAQRPTTH